MDWKQIRQVIQTQGMQLLSGLLVLVVGFFLVHWVLKLSRNRLEKIKIEPTVKSFLNRTGD